MARALNLRKRLSNWVNKILVELSYHYIIQKAKQTSRKPDNSSSKEFLPSHLATEHRSTTIVTSSQDTSEKITMMETEEIVSTIRDWALDRFDDNLPIGDSLAIYQEFAEWIEPQGEELEIVTLDEISEEEYEDFIERG